ncbi:hypothetical protein EDD18DRAFT_1105470 [Armillaria luteobubalina]|uniref:Uncharacterized protein n=1 Tax=Armillaria luteobubalina TaxID=153913 RepID=A0AA39UWW9_9AGAR|nr:hypothetical protein EDD18DRAFT_1105470 [Armillaria luteobubalina]
MISLKQLALSKALLMSTVAVNTFTGPATATTLLMKAENLHPTPYRSNAVACGVITDSNGVWLSTSLYGSGSHCGESIQAQYTSLDNGRTVMVKVVDKCLPIG